MFRVLIIASALLAATAVSAETAKPLSDVVSSTKVGSVSTSGTVQVPIITWGGDMATLVANGNAFKTASGSPFGKNGLSLKLVREDVFVEQLQAYISGKSPYLRGTVGMIQQAADVLCKDDRTCPKVVYQMTWSAGGDALVAGPSIRNVKDLRGKKIAVQAYGPHVDYLTKILSDGGLSPKDVDIVWMQDLTGTAKSPAEALLNGKADAAMVIIPDALALTSNGNVGTGSEGSLKGARIMLSTKTANKIIADVYAVRSDYLNSSADKVEGFVNGLMQGAEQLSKTLATNNSERRSTLKFAAQALLDSPQATADAEALYADAQFVGYAGNVEFFTNGSFPRRYSVLSQEAVSAFKPLGLVSGRNIVSAASMNYAALQRGLSSTTTQSGQTFDPSAVAAVVSRRQQQNNLQEGELFSFEIFFEPNQNDFPADLYEADFKRVVELASTYGGAIILVEGHSDPMGYLRKRKAGSPPVVLSRIKQAAKNLSLTRANAVRSSLISFADQSGITLDRNQFTVDGRGILDPKSGLCGSDPCAPKTEKAWRGNMRVRFRIIQIEAEANVFQPL